MDRNKCTFLRIKKVLHSSNMDLPKREILNWLVEIFRMNADKRRRNLTFRPKRKKERNYGYWLI